MSAVTKLRFVDPSTERVLMPEAFGHVQGNGRAIAVAMFRELADKLESGELDGARIQWRDDAGPESEMVTVTVDAKKVQVLTTTIGEV